MKTRHLFLFLLFTISGLLSCTPKVEPIVTDGSGRAIEKTEDITMWVDSRYGPEAVGLHGNKYDCYNVSYNTEMTQAPDGMVILSDVEPLCSYIGNFDYEEGNFYKVIVTKTTYKPDPTLMDAEGISYTIKEVLQTIKDVQFKKEEIIEFWVGPKILKLTGSHGQPIDCLQVSYTDRPPAPGVEWDSHCYGIEGFKHQLGKLQKVRVKRIHASEFDLTTISHPVPYTDSLLDLISK